ncbi:BglG family transcription antiterminator [Saccharibacillus sp. O23]|uniref:BglG family transcription antiterminator n=1 Tax=Saccharibacillus sp. O23 TaxID=2009338 RepID=UPI00211AEAD8|nr:BglG family transcription antiterminator [Saccharibacillus sp. O23]
MDERSASILALLQRTNDYVPVGELMETFGISKRTVHYDMQKINGWLNLRRLPSIEYVRETGYLLPEESRCALPANVTGREPVHYYPSRHERTAWLGLYLLERRHPVYLHHMEAAMKISRGTAHAELGRLGMRLSAHRSEIAFDRKEGYRAVGEEQDLRGALFRFLTEVFPSAGRGGFMSRFEDRMKKEWRRTLLPGLNKERLLEVSEIIGSGERKIGMELTDETIGQLSALLILQMGRIGRGCAVKVDKQEKQALKAAPQYRAAAEIASKLEAEWKIPFSEDEIAYLTILLLTGKVNKFEAESNGSADRQVRDAALKMIDDFERIGCVRFRSREELERQLFFHIKALFYRNKYGVFSKNPLTDTVMKDYGEIFELTRRSALPLRRLLGREPDDHETAYLAAHFGGQISDASAIRAPRRTAAIVCVNGVSSSRLLKAQLAQLVPDIDVLGILSLREYEKFGAAADFIFSTIPLPESSVPVFVVPAILGESDKVHLLNRVLPHLDGQTEPASGPSAQAIVELVGRHADISDKARLTEEIQRYLNAVKTKPPREYKPGLDELLRESRIAFGEAEDWRSAIRLAASPLLEEGCIEPSYVQAMIASVEAYGPYIVTAPGIAIAHAKPEDGALRDAVSLLCLRRGTPFGSEARHLVHTLFVMVSSDGASHLKALTQLSRLLSDKENRRLMGGEGGLSDILRLVRRYSAD